MRCLKCGRALVKIGSDRTGGRSLSNTTGKDWATRKYHKKCWKELQEDKAIERMLEEYKTNKETDLNISP
tara:strand:- start:4201 stop:4410 length:210 start_codon:yes stop_codon:yes gene_type:complete